MRPCRRLRRRKAEHGGTAPTRRATAGRGRTRAGLALGIRSAAACARAALPRRVGAVPPCSALPLPPAATARNASRALRRRLSARRRPPAVPAADAADRPPAAAAAGTARPSDTPNGTPNGTPSGTRNGTRKSPAARRFPHVSDTRNGTVRDTRNGTCRGTHYIN